MRNLAVLSMLGLLAGCAPDPLSAYDVVLKTTFDCSQVGLGAVQCTDDETLAALSISGRWIIEDKGGANLLNPASDFILTAENGRTVTGLHFVDTGAIETQTCGNETYGQCYFGRKTATTFDQDLSCTEISDFAYDFLVLDDEIAGLSAETRVTEETCGTSVVSQVIVEVTGTRSEDAVYAREDLTP